MHELALSEQIVRTALEAAEAPPDRLAVLAVDVGALSGANAASLKFCLRTVLDESGMKQTQIRVRTVPARLKCECGHAYSAKDLFAGCPRCGGLTRSVVGGKDVTIKYIEVKNEET